MNLPSSVFKSPKIIDNISFSAKIWLISEVFELARFISSNPKFRPAAEKAPNRTQVVVLKFLDAQTPFLYIHLTPS